MLRCLPVIALLFLVSACGENDKSKGKSMDTQSRFKAPEWVHNTNIYEVNLRQYTKEGSFDAFAQHLPRLKEMGVKTLWFMPVTPIAKKNRKGSLGSYYACSDYTAINPEFGDLNDFKELVKNAHSHGMKVIIDWVANHTGWDHRWTKEHPDYYLIDSVTGDFKIASGMDDIIELDFSNPELRKAMIEAMKFWVEECDIDGFRCDLAFWVQLDFWKEARPQLDAIKPLLWFGEFDELEKPEYGEAFDVSYTWTWMHRAKDFYQKEQAIDSLYTVLKNYDDLGDSTMRSWFTTNHDENSWNGTEYEKYGEMAKALAVFSCTWNGVPLVYSGQELPVKKRIKFFEKDTIEWAGKNELESFYKTLLSLHSNNPALRAGDPSVQTFRLKTSNKNIFAYLRKKEDKEVVVLLNMSDDKLSFELLDPLIKGKYREVFSNSTNDLASKRSFEMQAWDYLVFEK